MLCSREHLLGELLWPTGSRKWSLVHLDDEPPSPPFAGVTRHARVLEAPSPGAEKPVRL